MITPKLANSLKGLSRSLARRYDVSAEDLYSEAYVAVLEKQAKYDPNRGAMFSTWAYAVGRNAMIDHVRREAIHRGELVDVAGMTLDSSDPADLLDILTADSLHNDDTEDALLLEQLLRRLTPRLRQVLELRLQGFTFDEIARDLGMTSDAARKAASRAMSHVT